jgi:hypothetical protein
VKVTGVAERLLGEPSRRLIDGVVRVCLVATPQTPEESSGLAGLVRGELDDLRSDRAPHGDWIGCSRPHA